MDKNYFVTVTGSGGKTFVLEVPEGKNLYKVLVGCDKLHFTAPCGGNGKCGKCGCFVNGTWKLACGTTVDKDLNVIINQQENKVKLELEKNYVDPNADFGFVVDIGTTTLEVQLYDITKKLPMARASMLNPQGAYGADVISRIDYTVKNKGGLEQLQKVVLRAIENLCTGICAETGIKLKNVKRYCIDGNTTMLHIFAGQNPKGLGISPFTPVFTDSRRIPTGTLSAILRGEFILLPSLSAYIGSDILAGVLSLNLNNLKNVLLVDMGTNGEMVLASKQGLWAVSTACGPAFEGAGISHGIGGVEGAICDVKIDGETVNFSTIGDAPPTGICGSGLVSLISELLKKEIIDETGYMEEDFCITGDIVLTTGDVRAVQNAKAAVEAGIYTLLDLAGLTPSDICKVYLAGGFGNFLNPVSAAGAGLIPAEFENISEGVGNSAIKGAALVLLSESLLDELQKIKSEMKYVELSGNKLFNGHYIDCMYF
ncbi:MAG: ASKHA domain-containing protein [Clostridiales bacterium]|jgi:uncharacterized 2Fe-2S/4Fe-4S cluster protein (DUF4445 family)|nr:ASKHA domain-containing protein [Clostridiales bacterium]